MRQYRNLMVGFALWAVSALPVSAANYHYAVEVASEFVADSSGYLQGLKVSWLYDETVSALLTEADNMTPARFKFELKRLSERMIADLHKKNYFASLEVGGVNQAFDAIEDYTVEFTKNKRLKLDFELPLAEPFALDGQKVQIRWSDPAGIGLYLYKSSDEVSLGTIDLTCAIEVWNYPNAEHLEIPQEVKMQC
ncbi:MAG: DUF1007 family protein [Pseudomonadota bacterium]